MAPEEICRIEERQLRCDIDLQIQFGQYRLWHPAIFYLVISPLWLSDLQLSGVDWVGVGAELADGPM
jgi:hypothetical protein